MKPALLLNSRKSASRVLERTSSSEKDEKVKTSTILRRA